MTHPRSAFGAPPQGGAPSGPAEPDPRLPLDWTDLSGQQVLVLGLGHSGLAMARWCVRHGAVVRVWDSRENPPQAAALHEACGGVPLFSGALGAAQLQGVQRVLKSPGLAPQDARIAPFLLAARAQGIVVQGELDLFAQALADLRAERGYVPQLLAITGTNGKTTTTALTALLVERAGRRVAAAGNIGPTLLDTLAAAFDADDNVLPDVWVLELSSFQLADAAAFEPTVGTVLNLSQDHLDWHGTMAAYAEAKSRVFGAHATLVLNRDDAQVMAMLPAPPVFEPKAAHSKRRATRWVQRRAVSFGLDAPQAAGDFGLVEQAGMAWLARALPADDAPKRRKGEAEDWHLQLLMPADALRLRGRHNAANALAALALATAIGCPLAPMLHALREYAGEPHRVAPVGVVQGVEAFDDSKGTNVGATVAALEGLGVERQPGKLVVILGGDGKGQDFAPLLAPVKRYVRAVALVGKDADGLATALAACELPMQRHDSLQAATAWCFAQARSGDAVLLSPACASLDMFRNYVHRAEVFVAAVHEVAAEHGEVLA
jgi:UDP-N-acetylmuramoylalanine--D-glutamate ligase